MKLSRDQQFKRIAYLFILPAFLFFLLLIAYPLVNVIWDSFHNKNLLNPSVGGFAGFENYIKVIQDEYFTSDLWNTIKYTFLSVLGEYILGITSAVVLTQKVKGRNIFRGMIVIPWVVPIVVAGLTWTWLLTPDYGVVSIWLSDIGLTDKPYFFLGEMNTALYTVILVNVWRSFPFYTITLIAGLQSIPKEMYEAAAIDGAGAWTRFFKITLPQLKTVSMVLVGIHIIWTAVNFDFIWIMTQGGPLHASETLPIMIYRFAMQDLNVGLASALASMMLAFMIIGFIAYYMYTSRKSKVD